MTQSATAWSFACYGCADFINDARTIAYHRWACANGLYTCENVPQVLHECYCSTDGVPDDYTDPVTDEVCWYDPGVPESAEFLGVLVRSRVAGGRDSTYTRSVGERVTRGSVLQRPRLRGRSFGFEVVLLGTTCQGVEYGIEWLRRTLEGAGCDTVEPCDACAGRRLRARVYCPDETATEDNGLRDWLTVGTIDGMVEVEDEVIDRSCCCVRAYTFTMHSQSPYSFTAVGDLESVIVSDEEYQACYDWTLGCVECGNDDCLDCENCDAVLDVCEACRAKCGSCNRCGYDPVCQTTPVRAVPPLLIEPDECIVCDPLSKIIQCFAITGIDGQIDSTFLIDVFSGYDLDNPTFQSRGLRNLAVKVYQNPLNLPPPTDDASYLQWRRREACADVRVRFVPPNAHLIIDGRSERVSVLCDGVCQPFEQVVTGQTSATVFPLALACYNALVCVEWDATQVQPVDNPPRAVPSSVTVQRYRQWLN